MPQWPFGETGIVLDGLSEELVADIPGMFIELLLVIDAGLNDGITDAEAGVLDATEVPIVIELDVVGCGEGGK